MTVIRVFICSLLLCFVGGVTASEQFTFCYERWKPYSFKDDSGRSVGETITLIEKALLAANISASYSELPFARCIAAVDSGHIMFALHTDEDERLPIIDIPIAYWRLALAVKSDSQISDQTLNLFKSLNILQARSYQYPPELNEFYRRLGANVVKANYYTENDSDVAKLFGHLSLARVDAMVVDRIWAQHMITALKLPVRLLEQDIYVQPQYVGFFKGNQQQAETFKRALTAILD